MGEGGVGAGRGSKAPRALRKKNIPRTEKKGTITAKRTVTVATRGFSALVISSQCAAEPEEKGTTKREEGD